MATETTTTNLPAIIAQSDKQRAFAESARTRTIPYIESALTAIESQIESMRRASVNPNSTEEKRARMAALVAIGEPKVEATRAAFVAICAQADARFWLDMQALPEDVLAQFGGVTKMQLANPTRAELDALRG